MALGRSIAARLLRVVRGGGRLHERKPRFLGRHGRDGRQPVEQKHEVGADVDRGVGVPVQRPATLAVLCTAEAL